MAFVNTCILAGNLTRDPELRYSPKGTAIISGSVAVNRSWKAETGETKEEVSFIEFRSFGRTAEVIGQYFSKGGNILLQGRLQQERWNDKQTNEPRTKVVMIAESFQFMNKNGSEAGERGAAKAATPAPSADQGGATPKIDDEDVPF